MPETIHLAVGIALAVSFIAMGAAFQSFYGDEPVVQEKFVQNYCNNNKPCVDFMTKHYVTNSSFAKHNQALLTIFETLDKKVDGLQGSVTLLQAQGDVTTLPSPTPALLASTIILNLEISDNSFNVKPSGYPRDVAAILITGQSDFVAKAYVITITDPAGGFVKDKFGKTLSDGDVSEAWVVPQDALPGKYKVTITIDNKIDSIEFTLL